MIFAFDASDEQISYFNVLCRSTNLAMTLLGIPFLSKVLKIHETGIMVLFTISAAILNWFSSYATTFRVFAIISAPAELRFLCFSVGRYCRRCYVLVSTWNIHLFCQQSCANQPCWAWWSCKNVRFLEHTGPVIKPPHHTRLQGSSEVVNCRSVILILHASFFS